MSGTSLDGVDAALIETDGYGTVKPLGFVTIPYEPAMREALRACFGKRAYDEALRAAERELTLKHAEAVKLLLESHAPHPNPLPTGERGLKVDVIGFHGQTITHAPEDRFTWQIGDAGLLARETGIDVMSDFRSADVKAGGQGAPLLPLYHRARVMADGLRRPVAIVNIGGVGNVTWIGDGPDDILAFDTGPGNALMDDFIKARTGKDYDENGDMARSGHLDDYFYHQWRDDPYFKQKPPKSLDRNKWNIEQLKDLSTEDGLATLAVFAGETIVAALGHMPKKPKAWYVAGGGRKNGHLMNYISKRLNSWPMSWLRKIPVEPVEALGWNGDALEAEGFAYLAVRSLLKEPLSLPSTTGVPKPVTGGVYTRA